MNPINVQHTKIKYKQIQLTTEVIIIHTSHRQIK